MLHTVLQKQPKKHLTEKQCSRIIRQILSGMEFFHQLNIAHRDLKPENILVDMSSPTLETKIIDFGFAAQSA